MRIAYLILAHEFPLQLARLVNVLNSDNARIYIHIDKKANEEEFREVVREGENIKYTQERVFINWMGFSLVEATLRLMRAAVSDGFEYCVLLSGACYPIKSNEYIEGFYNNRKNEYISFWRLKDRPSWEHKVQYYYLIDAIPIRGWSNNNEPVYWRKLFWGRFFKYRNFFPKRKFIKGIEPYGGPDWWSISFGCAEYVLDFLEKRPDFKRYFMYTQSPGELFFQTIILNSPFSERVEKKAVYEAWSAEMHSNGFSSENNMLEESSFNFRYIDWSGERTGAREAPAILDERDWAHISKSDCHFARKVHPQRSAHLLDLIDEKLLKIK